MAQGGGAIIREALFACIYAGVHWANAALWGVGCLAVGALTGFLFAVPKVYQAEAPAARPTRSPNPSEGTGAAGVPARLIIRSSL